MGKEEEQEVRDAAPCLNLFLENYHMIVFQFRIKKILTVTFLKSNKISKSTCSSSYIILLLMRRQRETGCPFILDIDINIRSFKQVNTFINEICCHLVFWYLEYIRWAIVWFIIVSHLEPKRRETLSFTICWCLEIYKMRNIVICNFFTFFDILNL